MMSKFMRFLAWISLASCNATALADDYPVKPIRIITSEAGGGTDFTARLIAQRLTPGLGQQVLVDNRVTVIGQEIAAKAPSDGYTLLVSSNSIWIAPLLQKMRYDPVSDFAPVTLATSSPTVLVVHPSVPANSVRDLVDLAKAEPGRLNYASGPLGTSNQIAGELFKFMAGVKIVRISYKGAAPALTDLVGGRVQVMFPNGPSLLPYLKSGKLRPLAVASAQSSLTFPGLPTVAASGLPGFEASLVTAVFAPAKVPAERIGRIGMEILRVLKSAEVRDSLVAAGVDVIASSPGELTLAIKNEMARVGAVIKAGGMSGE